MNLSNRFITIEGVDGAGKSSHVQSLIDELNNKGYKVLHTREPGGTQFGEKLRDLVLNEPMDPYAETMLFFALRKQHIEELIKPHLEQGYIVICDRFTDSTWAYQYGAKKIPAPFIAQLEQITHGDLQPGMTLLFDLPVEESLRRLKKTEKNPDKFESESPDFFTNVRDTYLMRAKQDPNRIHIINSNQTYDQVRSDVFTTMNDYFNHHKILPEKGNKKRFP